LTNQSTKPKDCNYTTLNEEGQKRELEKEATFPKGQNPKLILTFQELNSRF
jgi:hypothetical protein